MFVTLGRMPGAVEATLHNGDAEAEELRDLEIRQAHAEAICFRLPMLIHRDAIGHTVEGSRVPSQSH
jgi:hypothetical protein